MGGFFFPPRPFHPSFPPAAPSHPSTVTVTPLLAGGGMKSFPNAGARSPPRLASPCPPCSRARHTAMSMWARHSASTPSAEHLTPSSHAWRAGAHSHTHTHTQQTAWTHVHAEEVGGGGGGGGATSPTLRDGHILERPIAPHRLWVIRRGCSTQTIDGWLPAIRQRADKSAAPPRSGFRASNSPTWQQGWYPEVLECSPHIACSVRPRVSAAAFTR